MSAILPHVKSDVLADFSPGWLSLDSHGSDVENPEAGVNHGGRAFVVPVVVRLSLALLGISGAAVLAPLMLRPMGAVPAAPRPIGAELVVAAQKRVVVGSLAEGMSSWPRTIRELQYLADATNHTVTVPCVSLSSGRIHSCSDSSTTGLTDLFDLSGWGLTPFDAGLDSNPDVEFAMCAPSFAGCAKGMMPGPTTVEDWTHAVSSNRSVGVAQVVAGHIRLRADQLNSSRGNDLSSTTRNQSGKVPGGADDWPQFNFSAAREAEAARILAANGLRPSADGREGNYVVYHWRSEAIDVNYTFCAQELLSHIEAQHNESGKRLVLVSDMPFNASVLPALWATTTAAKIGLQPTFPAARDMLMEAGFTKIEMMAQNAGYDLKSVPTAYISIWDAIIARGGEKLTLCRAEECTRCSRTRSKFLSLIRHHYLQHHGPRSRIEESWMAVR
mmetsp:Transcript_98015/g.263359  ORF Transcript_98015/g.263359 Transcript_98015/m.263359 type:complete len:444 (-) Transcript_98015:621-1952(-)